MEANELRADDLLNRAREILRSGPICDECLGRAFARLSTGLSNTDRGRALRITLSMLGEPHHASGCWVCDGLFEQADAWAQRALALVEGIEFSTFLFGVALPPRAEAMETLFAERFPGRTSEPLKHAFNRVVGLAFERRIPGRTVAFTNPDVNFLIDPQSDTISLSILSLYVYGRYRKLVRGLPQTRWPCRRCRGRGCDACQGTGKQYPESVEELIAAPFIEHTLGAGSHLHGAGREDIDALMLGTGRPFVLEVLSPRRRTLDLERLREEVNDRAADRVEVSRLTPANRRTVAIVKETRSTKRYRALVEFTDEVAEEQLTTALASLIGVIDQRTPRRVAHRRADLVRRRRLFEATGRLRDPHQALVEFHADGGTYIKELVSGDEGRTEPCLATRLAVGAHVRELDVMEITSSEFPD